MARKRIKDNSHVCPWWFIWVFDNPIRKWMHKPEVIFSGLVGEGDIVLDVGCGAGFFSVPLARMVGATGKVIAADLQEKMLSQAARRAARAGVPVQLHKCSPGAIGLDEQVDVINAFWMVHEVPNQSEFLSELYTLLKPGGVLLVAEPKMHVSLRAFERLMALARGIGYQVEPKEGISFSRAAVLWKG